MSSTSVVRTRRRGAALEAAILDAGWEHLLDAGYERFTIEAVAERSATARSVLYRRWSSRLDLFEAVIRRRGAVDALPLPDTGTLRGDVLALLTDFNRRRVRMVGLLASGFSSYYRDAGTSPQELRQWMRPAGPNNMEFIVARAVERGELAELPPSRVVLLPVDLLRHELFMTGAPASAQTLVEIVDDIFLPLITTTGGSQSASKL